MYSEIAANKRKTWVLLIGFLGLIYALSWVYGRVYGNSTIVYGALAGAAIYALITYFAAGRMAVAMNGAKEIEKRDNPRLWNTVENLAITNGMPMPKVYIIPDRGLNAFATGRNPDKAIVAATQGLLDVMNDKELQGVMAHELGHVKNYDIRVSMIAFALVSVVSIMADMMMRGALFGGALRGGDDDEGPGGGAFSMALGIAAMIAVPIVASMIQMAVSRRREYLADATGVMTTRYPEGLASALEKIRDGGSHLKRANASTAHLFISNPLSGKSLASLFSTHPPVDDRIGRIRNMSEHI